MTSVLRDRKFWWHLTFQGLVAVVFMWLVLAGLDKVARSTIIWAAGASSLASSSYIVFCAPGSIVARPLKIIGGYVIAVVVGECMRLLALVFCHVIPSCHVGVPFMHVFEVAAALSVGIALLLMILFKSEHPPAAGLAVVMVLDIRNYYALSIILFAACVLAFIRYLFRNKLCNLC